MLLSKFLFSFSTKSFSFQSEFKFIAKLFGNNSQATKIGSVFRTKLQLFNNLVDVVFTG